MMIMETGRQRFKNRRCLTPAAATSAATAGAATTTGGRRRFVFHPVGEEDLGQSPARIVHRTGTGILDADAIGAITANGVEALQGRLNLALRQGVDDLGNGLAHARCSVRVRRSASYS